MSYVTWEAVSDITHMIGKVAAWLAMLYIVVIVLLIERLVDLIGRLK